MLASFDGRASGAYAYPLTIGDILDTAVAARSGSVIVGSDGSRRSYNEFADRVRCAACALSDLGVQAGDTVAVMDWDSHRYLELFFAVPMIGAVLQTVNVRLSHHHIAHVMAQTEPCVLLAHIDFHDIVVALPVRPRAIVLLVDRPGEITQARAPASRGCPDYEALLARSGPIARFPALDENSIATTFHTSGTTGLPKAVAFGHRQLVLHTLAVTAALALQPQGQNIARDDVYMPITPMFHVHAWGLPYVATMLGLKQVYPGRYRADRLIRLQQDEGVTFSHGVPTILAMLLDALGDRRIEERWKMLVGGSALPQALYRRAREQGIDALTGYGMSETAPLISMSRHAAGDADRAEDALCRAGRPLPLVKVRIAGAAGQDSAEGAPGELVLRAPWLTQGYVHDPAASERLWAGGWLHTGDIAEIRPTGDIAIVDRLKDVIKTGGEWVSSAQIEDILLGHPAVAEAAVIGIPDARWGERPMAFVVPRGPAPADEDLREHLRAAVRAGIISAYAIPDRIVSRNTLPRTSVGKLDKKALRDILPDGRDHDKQTP